MTKYEEVCVYGGGYSSPWVIFTVKIIIGRSYHYILRSGGKLSLSHMWWADRLPFAGTVLLYLIPQNFAVKSSQLPSVAKSKNTHRVLSGLFEFAWPLPPTHKRAVQNNWYQTQTPHSEFCPSAVGPGYSSDVLVWLVSWNQTVKCIRRWKSQCVCL